MIHHFKTTIFRRVSRALWPASALLLAAAGPRTAAQDAPVSFQPLPDGTRIILSLPELEDYVLERIDRSTLSVKISIDEVDPQDFLVRYGYGLAGSIEPISWLPGELTLIIRLPEDLPPLEVTDSYRRPHLIIDLRSIAAANPGGGEASREETPVGGGMGLKFRGYSMQVRPRLSFFLPDGSVRVSLEEVLGSIRLLTETYYDVVRGDMGYLLGYHLLPVPLQPGMEFFDSFEFKSIITGESAWIRRKGARVLVTHSLQGFKSSYRFSGTRVSSDRYENIPTGLDNSLGWLLEYDRWSPRPSPRGSRLTFQLDQSIPYLGSKQKYGRLHLIGEKAWSVGSRLVLLEEFHLGHPLWWNVDLPYYASFELAGRDLLRGYRRTRDRSQIVTLLKSEVWFPFRQGNPRSYWRLTLESVDLFGLLDLGYRTNRRSQIAQWEKYKGAWGGGLQLRASVGALDPQSVRLFFAKGLTRDRKPLFYLTVTY